MILGAIQTIEQEVKIARAEWKSRSDYIDQNFDWINNQDLAVCTQIINWVLEELDQLPVISDLVGSKNRWEDILGYNDLVYRPAVGGGLENVKMSRGKLLRDLATVGGLRREIVKVLVNKFYADKERFCWERDADYKMLLRASVFRYQLDPSFQIEKLLEQCVKESEGQKEPEIVVADVRKLVFATDPALVGMIKVHRLPLFEYHSLARELRFLKIRLAVCAKIDEFVLSAIAAEYQ